MLRNHLLFLRIIKFRITVSKKDFPENRIVRADRSPQHSKPHPLCQQHGINRLRFQQQLTVMVPLQKCPDFLFIIFFFQVRHQCIIQWPGRWFWLIKYPDPHHFKIIQILIQISPAFQLNPRKAFIKIIPLSPYHLQVDLGLHGYNKLYLHFRKIVHGNRLDPDPVQNCTGRMANLICRKFRLQAVC